MEKNLKNGFHLVFCKQELKTVISFLESGFKWSPARSTKLFQTLEKQSPKIPTAAVVLDKGQIAVGILLFHQGYNETLMKNIINMSAWYAKESHRGVKAILFAKTLTLGLEGFVITNFTPSQAVCKILKFLKYKDMKVRKVSIGASKKFPFIDSNIQLKDISFSKYSIKPRHIEMFDNYEEYSHWLYKLDKFKKFRLSFSEISLYSMDQKSKLNFFWILKMAIRYRIFRVNLLIRDYDEFTPDVWLIRNSDNDLFIPPTKSELVI